MRKLRIVLTVFACVLSLSLVANTFASEGNQMKGSAMADEKASVAIDGYCPVCITNGMYVKGSPKFSTEYKGKIYHFPGFDQQKMFINDPDTYIAGLEKKYKELKEQSKGSDMQKGPHKKGS
ncbi:MAG: hypothetical protein COV72_00090 [Candidatus Omnitrophica bacterium CG11_big_fil_rev_8_21_14_0_20_42_13]|uniref:YHS domain-containing protein n=1 Tax=Candidatus Ghiorseimicrobium undicola TaxID=1974746 RepID=A0A2H0M050_9BACT|nr:MAG: hypothetical protein COV72_00090 [Candidatus Omnitrophica bacterium CG11_big_fil_rev_8_21_14_0_20_42_13]